MKEALAQTQQELEEVRDAVITLADSIEHLATKEELKQSEFANDKRRRRWFWGVVILVTATASALVSQWSASNNAEKEAVKRSYASCAVFNENKHLITEILALSAGGGADLPGLTHEQVEALKRRSQEFDRKVAPLLKPVNCDDFVEHPEEYLDAGLR